MERFRPYPVAAFCAVTLVIWLNRIWLAWTANVGLGSKLVSSVPITFFVVAAFVLLGVRLGGADPSSSAFVGLVRAFAAGTVLYWAIRLPMIATNHHPLAFVAVHAVLAVVSVVAAVLAWRSVPPMAVEQPAPPTSDRTPQTV
jgi:hypothetical protein